MPKKEQPQEPEATTAQALPDMLPDALTQARVPTPEEMAQHEEWKAKQRAHCVSRRIEDRAFAIYAHKLARLERPDVTPPVNREWLASEAFAASREFETEAATHRAPDPYDADL